MHEGARGFLLLLGGSLGNFNPVAFPSLRRDGGVDQLDGDESLKQTVARPKNRSEPSSAENFAKFIAAGDALSSARVAQRRVLRAKGGLLVHWLDGEFTSMPLHGSWRCDQSSDRRSADSGPEVRAPLRSMPWRRIREIS